ncbi:unnamed protein product [Ectocarpus sp. 13 AM-2016]
MKSQGSTPLHKAAKEGRFEVVGVLIGALASPNSRMVCKRSGTVALRGKANPFLTKKGNPSWGGTAIPMDVAAFHGHSDVVRELAQWRGCGVASAGQALLFASSKQHLDTMAILTGTGVDRMVLSLLGDAGSDLVAYVKFLLRQRYRGARSTKYLYVNARDTDGCTPLAHASCISRCCSHAPRIVRLLVRAGADVELAIRVTNSDGEQE